MKKWIVLCACFSQLFCSEKEKDIIEFIRISTLPAEQIDTLVSAMVQGSIAMSQVEADSKQAEEMIKKTLLSDEFLKQFVGGFDEKFSHEEIRQLIGFFKSDAMKKYFKNYAETSGQFFPKINQLVTETVQSVAKKPAEKDFVLTLSGENYTKEVTESDIPVIVDVYSTMCGPCQKLAPIFSELSGQYKGKVKFAKINADHEFKICQELKVHAMPTLLFIKNGKVIDRHVGLVDKGSLNQKIEEAFKKG